MTEEHREIAGFLCRWFLLALVAATLAGAGWAAAAAAEAIAAETSAAVVLPDGIARERHTVWLVGYVHPRLPYSASTVMLYRRSGEDRVRWASVRDGKVNWYPDTGDAGLKRLEFRGQPHGPLATTHQSMRLLVVSTYERLWLIDARWARSVSRHRREGFAELPARLDAQGAVAMFHTGPLGDFERCRDELRENGLQYAVLMELSDDAQDPAYILRRASRRIRRWDHNRDIHVITDDAELAERAVEDGFRTHLVSPEYTAEPGRLLTVHRSLDELKENLLTLPIP